MTDIEKRRHRKEPKFEENPTRYKDPDLLFFFNMMHELWAKAQEGLIIRLADRTWSDANLIKYYSMLIGEMSERNIKQFRSSDLDDKLNSLEETAKSLSSGQAEAGVHLHNLEREHKTTKKDGTHQHLFVLPDGLQVLTLEDGEHVHSLSSAAANETGDKTSAHRHSIELPDGTELMTEEDGVHSHELQVWSTVLDGIHTHKLKLPDGEVIESVTAGEFWAMNGRPNQAENPPSLPASELASLKIIS